MIGLPKSSVHLDGILKFDEARQFFNYHWDYVAEETNFTFLLAIFWWYVSPFAIPPISNLLTLFILTAPWYRAAMATSLFTSKIGRVAFHSMFGMVAFKRPADVLYFGISFLYKSIILESKMGPRRYIFLTMLIGLATGGSKFICEQMHYCVSGGPYATLITLKIITHKWAKTEHPIRFPHAISIFARKAHILEYVIIALLCQDPKDIIFGVALGLIVSQLPFVENRFCRFLLGPVVTLPYTRVLVSGPRRVIHVIAYFLPRISAIFLIGATLAQYFCSVFPEGVNLFCAIPSGQYYVLLIPSFGAVSLTHLIYTCTSAYIVMYHMHKIFLYQVIMLVYLAILQVLTHLLYVVITNLSYKCPPFSNQCVPPGTEIVGITATLLSFQVFAGIMRHKAEWRNYALTVLRACGEVVLIFAFLPEIDARLHLIGAGAGFALACTHQRPPRYIKQEIRPSDITIERPESNVSAKIIGPEGSSILSPDSDAETSGIRRSKLKIVTRRTSKKPPSKPPLESREPSTSRASFPLLPPKVILVLGSTPPMYVPVSIQGTPQPYPARPAGMLRTSQPPTPQNQMTTRPRGSRSPPSCYTR